jgi:hypothetical protein
VRGDGMKRLELQRTVKVCQCWRIEQLNVRCVSKADFLWYALFIKVIRNILVIVAVKHANVHCYCLNCEL